MSNCNRSANNCRTQRNPGTQNCRNAEPAYRTGMPGPYVSGSRAPGSERGRELSYEKDKELWRMPLAMAYVPWQQFTGLYDEDEALCKGTIFSELNLVFTGRGCCN